MSSGTIWLGTAAVVALMLSAALNLALRVRSRSRLAERFEQRGWGDRFESFVAVRPQYMLATAALRTLASVAVLVTTLVAAGALSVKPDLKRLLVGLGSGVLLLLVFGVAVPNAWAKYAGESLIVRTLPLLAGLRWLFRPVVWLLEAVDPLVRRLCGVPVQDARSYADELEQEILDVVSEGERHGAVDEQEKEMIESVMELTDTRVEEIMTPRTEMVALPKEADLDDVREVVRTRGHSRIPVYDGTIDTILGVLYVKDLLLRDESAPFDITREMRPALFIPESKPVRELLREFQTQKMHMAVVLDEYGGTAGLVTIEDILEELVGEIADEYDAAPPAEFTRIDDETVEVDARMRIDDLNDRLHLHLPEDEDFETIGGLVFSRLGKIPHVGEHWEDGEVAIDVVGAEPRRITRLRLKINRHKDNGNDR
ncbi:MAG: HlyC/CorC family transporter [Planctomycetota bacterium]|nr:MAG: HlyC/CorC family transporter [Planctomycetota bacterium]